MVLKMRKFLLLVILLISFLYYGSPIYSQTPTPDNSPAIQDLQSKIKDLQNKIVDLQGQAKTLSSQIAIMDNQIRLTEVRIDATQRDISNLTLDIDTATKKITSLQDSLDILTGVLLNRIVATYEVGTAQPFEVLISSDNVSNFFTRLNYLKIAQSHDKKLVYETQQAKNDYTNQKQIFENKKRQVERLKAQLESYTNQLAQEKTNKQSLLAQTQGSEGTYQQLLSQAQAQLNALSSFATSRTGGVQIVSHSDLSDTWGKYYNQRDANWGNNIIGLSNMTVWSVGCLLTSYAMVYTHYGGSTTPSEVAANSGNFSLSTALFLRPGPSASGHSVNAIYSPSFDYLREQLNSGHAIIAGLSYDGGPIADHWLVLRSVDGDSFKVNDPLYEGAMNVSLNDHYKSLKIVEARIYQ